MSLRSLRNLSNQLSKSAEKMPVLFMGHGSPMNGIEDNEFSRKWSELARELPVPKAVLSISAHWLTRGTHVTAMKSPRTIHDFGGFPKSLFDVQYPAPGDPLLANETRKLIASTDVGVDHDWGLDHGTWTVVRHMYPNADIPIIQLSIDYHQSADHHYRLARELALLRNQGVLIMGSGNMVHNLGMVAWDRINDDFGFDWTLEMNELLKDKISSGDHKSLIDYTKLSPAAQLAIPTPDHYYPLIYTLGLVDQSDQISFFNDKAQAGSLTMTSVQFG